MSYYSDFDLDIPAALKDQLIVLFEELVPARLSDVSSLSIPDAPGVYGLFHGNDLMYIGKADRLRHRLMEHHTKINRQNHTSASDVGFTCLTVNRNWIPLAPQNVLLRHYKAKGLCRWNGTGIGI